MLGPMVAIRCIANAPINCISKYRATSEVRTVNPEMVISFSLDGFIQSVERDARFQKARAIIRVDVQD